MTVEFKLPDIGEGIAEGEIARWHVKEGQEVAENDPFVEIMTDKATVEIPAPAAGVIQSIRFEEGTTVPVGEVIAVIGAGGEAAPSPALAAVVEPVAATAGGNGQATEVAPMSRAAAPTAQPATALPGGRVLAAPAVRRRAREQGVDLTAVQGTGPAGRITRADLERALTQPAAPASVPTTSVPTTSVPTTSVPTTTAPAATPAAIAAPRPATPPAPAPQQGEERIPLRGIRKRIAERMSQSKNTAAHFTYVDDCDVTELVSLRQSLKEKAAEQGVKLTYMPFIVKAVTTTLRQFPSLNASLDDERQEIVIKHHHNIGFAADTDAGLMVPVIRQADQRSLLNLGAAINDLAARAREGKLELEEVTGSTFTITNAGNIGGILATPVINYPEVAILGVHKIQDRAMVVDGEIVVRKMMNLSISLDHRVVDGAVGARFMNEVIRILQDPRLLLLGTL